MVFVALPGASIVVAFVALDCAATVDPPTHASRRTATSGVAILLFRIDEKFAMWLS